MIRHFGLTKAEIMDLTWYEVDYYFALSGEEDTREATWEEVAEILERNKK